MTLHLLGCYPVGQVQVTHIVHKSDSDELAALRANIT